MVSDFKMPILMYHSIMDNHKQSVTIKSFEKQMFLMKRMGYQTINFNELNDINNNKKFIITFDDGYENIFLNAYPILKKLNFTATCFFIANKIGKYNDWDEALQNFKKMRLMNFEQINEWVENDFHIGSHSMDHLNLKNLNYDQKIEQIVNSKKFFDNKFNININTFAYPFGSYDMESRNILKKYYDFAVTTKRSRYIKNKFDNKLLPRVPINSNENLFKFFLKIKTPYEDIKYKND